MSRRQLQIAGMLLGLWLAIVPLAAAQANATLSVNLTVQSSISLVFEQSNGGCALGNGGTNNVSLYFGWAVFTGSGQYSGCGTIQKLTGGRYQVSTPFNVRVSKANSNSPNYRLAAWLSSPPSADVAWVLNPNAQGNGMTLSTTMQTYEPGNSYQPRTEVLALQVKNTVPDGTLAATINFMATAN